MARQNSSSRWGEPVTSTLKPVRVKCFHCGWVTERRPFRAIAGFGYCTKGCGGSPDETRLRPTVTNADREAAKAREQLKKGEA